MMKHLKVAVVALSVLISLTFMSTPAFAASHCVGKDGGEISVSGAKGKAARAQCKSLGGTWKKAGKGQSSKKK
jgi:hypothetical protein